jgi:DNA-binding transcriptional LysR family regulator
MNVTLRQLKAFLGVAESSNFTKTSQRLHMSQAALSATVRELESQLDCRLFDRTTRNVRLTPAGLAFLPTATLIVREMEEAATRVQELGRKDVSQLKLGFTPLMAAHVLPEALERFLAASPQVLVEVVDAGPVELQRAVEAGQLDAAYGAFFSKASGLRHEPVLRWKLLVAAAARLTELPVPFRWKDLERHRLIALHEMSPVQQLTDSYLQREQVTPAGRWTVNQLETAIAMAEKGFGLAVIPSFAAGACRRYDVGLRPVSPAADCEFSQITRAGRAAPATLAAFTAIFAAVVEAASTAMVGPRG